MYYNLAQNSPQYAIIALLFGAIVFLFKKLLDTKDQQIQEQRTKSERDEARNQELSRMANNLMNLVEKKKR